MQPLSDESGDRVQYYTYIIPAPTKVAFFPMAISLIIAILDNDLAFRWHYMNIDLSRAWEIITRTIGQRFEEQVSYTFVPVGGSK